MADTLGIGADGVKVAVSAVESLSGPRSEPSFVSTDDTEFAAGHSATEKSLAGAATPRAVVDT